MSKKKIHQNFILIKVLFGLLFITQISYGYSHLKISARGNTVHNGSHFSEITLLKDGAPLTGIQVASYKLNNSTRPEPSNPQVLWDGEGRKGSSDVSYFGAPKIGTDAESHLLPLNGERIELIINFGRSYEFDAVEVGGYNGDLRSYPDVRVEVSQNGTNYENWGSADVFNSANFSAQYNPKVKSVYITRVCRDCCIMCGYHETAYTPWGDTVAAVGDTISFVPIINVDGNISRKGVWNSLDPKVAKVDSNGVVTGLSQGAASIVLQSQLDSNKADTVVLNVFNPMYIKIVMSGNAGGTQNFLSRIKLLNNNRDIGNYSVTSVYLMGSDRNRVHGPEWLFHGGAQVSQLGSALQDNIELLVVVPRERPFDGVELTTDRNHPNVSVQVSPDNFHYSNPVIKNLNNTARFELSEPVLKIKYIKKAVLHKRGELKKYDVSGKIWKSQIPRVLIQER